MNTTFTTQNSSLLGKLSGALLKSIFISFILVLGTANAWGYDWTANHTIYFNMENCTDFGTPYFRIGHANYNSANKMTLVSGTKYLYQYKQTSKWGGYDAFSVANHYAWTNNNSIYQSGNGITKQTDYQKYASQTTVYLKITGKHNKDGDCQYYYVNDQTNNGGSRVALPSYTVTYSTEGDGTLTVTKYDGSSYTALSSGTTVNPTQIIKIETSVGGEVTVTGAVQINEGNTYYVTENTTITATFAAPPTNSLTVQSGEGIASVTGSTDPVTLGGSYPITATPKTGYTFSTWTAEPAANATFGSATTANTTVTVKNGAVTVTATATEKTHDVTVSYKYGSTTIKDNTTTTAVGEANAKSITASSITGYTFKEWTLGSGITNKSANTTTSTISITTKESGNYTLTANYDVIPCNFLFGSSKPLNNPTDGGKMSYDPNEKAYYIDVTTNTTPYYFRFKYNSSKQYSCNWSTYPAGKEIKADGVKVDCDKEVTDWENKSALEFNGANGSTIRIWFDYTNKKAWITTKTYTVTVQSSDINMGTVTPATSTEMSETIGGSITAEPKAGYKFTNWTIESGSGSFTNANAASTTFKPTAVSTVQANFTANTYTITWDANDGSDNTTTSEYTYNGDPVNLPENPTRSGYTFNGWFTEQSGGTQITEIGTTIKPTSNVTYYAQWTAITYTVTLDQTDAATKGTASVTATYDAAMPAIGQLPTAKDGYAFAGYYDGKQDASTQYYDAEGASAHVWDKANDGTLYAKWEAITYTITYHLNGGSGAENSTYTIESKDITLPIPTQEGYTFGGWYDNEDCTGEAITEIAQGSIGHKVYYAKWTINSYTIDFGTENGGTVSATVGGNAINSGTLLTYGTQVVLTAFADAGYSFSKWTNGSSEVSTSNPYTVTIDGNITLNAVFIEATTLYLKPNADWLDDGVRFAAYVFGSSSAEPVWINMIQKQGECTGIYSCAIPAGYKNVIFCCMNASGQNGWDGHRVYQTEDLTIPTNSENLFTITTKRDDKYWYGKWELEPFNPLAYTITLEGEGGTIEITHEGGTATENTTVAPNTIITVALYPHSGYTVGTPKIKIGTNAAVNLVVGNEYTICGPTTITANWVETKYTVAVKSNNNNYGTVSTNSVQVGPYTPSTKITASPKAGYRFVNWTATEGVSINSPIFESTTITASQAGTLTANFEKDPTVYLKPSAVWKSDNARFAVYWWADGDKNGWIDMTTVGCNDEYYTAELPAGVTNFNFVRLNPNGGHSFNPNDAWNKTIDLTLPTNANNLLDMTVQKMYLKPNEEWKSDNARFAAYFYNDSDEKEWKSMISGTDGTYWCDAPDSKYTHVIFARMNNSNGTNDWGNKWNKTGNLQIKLENCFQITNIRGGGYDNTEELSKGEWWWYGDWTKLDLPTITYNQPENGTIIVKTIRGVEIPSGTKVPWDTQVLVSVQPNTGYSVKSANINIGGTVQSVQSGTSYTICGNTTISATMEEHTDYYLVGLDGDWSPKTKNKFVDGKLNINLEGNGTKEFKIIKQQGDAQEWLGKKFTFKPTVLTASGITDGGENMKIETVHNGIYQFTWNNGTLTVAYPDVCYLHGDFNSWTDYAGHALHNNRDAQVYLEAGNTYAFKVAERGVYRTQSGSAWETPVTYKAGGTTITMNDDTPYDAEPHHNSQITANMSGVYIFRYNASNKELTIYYPLDEGDYRLAYDDSEHDFHPERIIKKCTSGERLDTVSFFVHHELAPQIILQHCTEIVDGAATWETVCTYETTKNLETNIEGHGIDSTGVFNVVLQQSNEQTHAAQLLTTATHPYKGEYYIRTDVAPGKWNAFRQDSHKMTYSSYADNNEPFSHYFCEWVSEKDKQIKNVRYAIANDYADCISDVLAADPEDANPRIVIDENGDLPNSAPNANVRFGWDWSTNQLTRAYLSGSTEASDRFLVLIGDEKLKDANGNNFNVKGLNQHETNFADLQNWIYQVDVKASNETKVKLTAKYADKIQYFKGAASGEGEYVNLLAANANTEYTIRIIYDFKTNHLVAGWILNGDKEITEDDALGADMMIIRQNQGKAEQLTFNPNTKELQNVGIAYAVMNFTQGFITNNTKTQYERALYWISFPFDVQISEAFGFGEYGEHWIMQYYDGAARAERGLFSDSGTYWKYITDTKTTLEKGKGYVLTLDLDKVKNSFVHNISTISLYFPSKDTIRTISGTLPETMNVPAHKCEINMPDATPDNKRDRRIYDSHWNMIGVPIFADVKNFPTDNAYVKEDGLSFYYEYLAASNSYLATNKTADFQTMYGYMVQFAGDIKWQTLTVEYDPEPRLAARRNSDNTEPEKISFRLEIAQGEEMADQTFVQLQQEGATAEFDMNLDLTKIINSGANIYTLTNDRIQAAGNALPMEESVVPVGVQIAAEGEYTFRMPDGTEGMVVELIDYETNTRTNLLLSDYIITLPKGTSENRFALHIQPQKDVVTSLENIGEGVNNGEAVNKYLIDGKLIIRTAEGVFDAQGHRL